MTDIERQILVNQGGIISALCVMLRGQRLKHGVDSINRVDEINSNLFELGEKTLELLDKYK